MVPVDVLPHVQELMENNSVWSDEMVGPQKEKNDFYSFMSKLISTFLKFVFLDMYEINAQVVLQLPILMVGVKDRDQTKEVGSFGGRQGCLVMRTKVGGSFCQIPTSSSETIRSR